MTFKKIQTSFSSWKQWVWASQLWNYNLDLSNAEHVFPRDCEKLYKITICPTSRKDLTNSFLLQTFSYNIRSLFQKINCHVFPVKLFKCPLINKTKNLKSNMMSFAQSQKTTTPPKVYKTFRSEQWITKHQRTTNTSKTISYFFKGQKELKKQRGWSRTTTFSTSLVRPLF